MTIHTKRTFTRGMYRKALKNYSTTIGVDKTLVDIQNILLDFGAEGIGYEYDENGQILAINFKVKIDKLDKLIKVPSRVDKTGEVLRQQGKYKNADNAYRVAMRNVRDWLDAQLAMLSTQMVELPEIFLPYMIGKEGKTLYETVKDNKFLLPNAKNKG